MRCGFPPKMKKKEERGTDDGGRGRRGGGGRADLVNGRMDVWFTGGGDRASLSSHQLVNNNGCGGGGSGVDVWRS